MTRTVLRPDAITALWTFLVFATALSWWLGADHGLGSGRAMTAVVLAIAFAKAWAVGRWFMDLRRAPRALRAGFDLWALATAAGLVVLAVAGG